MLITKRLMYLFFWQISAFLWNSNMKLREANNKTCLAERNLFIWLWKCGHSVRYIGRQTGRSPTTVRRWVRRMLNEEYLQAKLNNARLFIHFPTCSLEDLVNSHNNFTNTSLEVGILSYMYNNNYITRFKKGPLLLPRHKPIAQEKD